MNFARLDMQLFAAILGAGIGVMVILYILKVRRRRVVVPHIELWQFAARRREARTLWQHLRRFFSFLLQAAFVTLLAFAIADPQRIIDPVDARSHVIIIDGTATMRTRLAGTTETRFDRAKALARQLAERKPSAEDAMIVVSSAHPTPLSPFSRDATTIVESISRAAPTDVHATLDEALRRGADFLLNRPSPRLTVITDFVTPLVEKKWRNALPAALHFEAHGVGERAANIGITSLSARRSLADPRIYELFASLRNFNEAETSSELSIYAVTGKRCASNLDCVGAGECVTEASLCGTVQETTRVPLKPGERVIRTFTGESSAAGRFVATLAASPGSTSDDFPTDNVATATLPPRPLTRVLHVTNGNLYLKGLFALAPEQFDVTEMTPDRFKSKANSLPAHDVILFEDFVPTEIPRVPYVVFAPSGNDAPFASAPEVKLPLVTDVSKKHPITRWLALKDVNIASAFPLKPRAGDTVLVRGISATGGDVPLVVARDGAIAAPGTRSSGGPGHVQPRALAIAFDVRRSDFALRVSFPLLIINTIHWFQGQSDSDTATYGTGIAQRVNVPRESRSLTIETPSGSKARTGVVGGVASFAPNQVGFYVLRDGDRELATVAANLPESADSHFSPPADARAATRIEPRAKLVERASFDIWFILVAIALALTTLEWVSYHRRLTV
ncbi:MAG: BatA domain-containing protein [Deltaproteobacteria bacterium]|nr:BatA domain-containing protein [Deltaproteobacteria bacterium]